MNWQAVVAALLVLGCSGYAAWTLMPAALRARLRPGQPPASGCGGCGGCAPAPARAHARPIRIVRRPPAA